MKNLKKVMFPVAFILMSLFSFAQEQETITLVSSKNLDGATEVFVDLSGTVQTESWDKDYIRIVLEIRTNGATKEGTKYLISKNRYKIFSCKTDFNSMELTSPNSVLPAFINGRELSEDVKYQIFVPRNVLVTFQEALEQ